MSQLARHPNRTGSAPPFVPEPPQFASSNASNTQQQPSGVSFNPESKPYEPPFSSVNLPADTVQLSVEAQEFKLEMTPEFQFGLDADFNPQSVNEVPEFKPQETDVFVGSSDTHNFFQTLNLNASSQEFSIELGPKDQDQISDGEMLPNFELDSPFDDVSDFDIPVDVKYTYSFMEIEQYGLKMDLNDVPEILNDYIQRQINQYDKKGNLQRSQAPNKCNTGSKSIFSWRKITEDELKFSERARKNTKKIMTEHQGDEKIEREIKRLLNRLSPLNIEKLKVQLLEIVKQHPIYLELLTKGIFNKAWAEQKYTQMYAELCQYYKKEFEIFRFPNQRSRNVSFYAVIQALLAIPLPTSFLHRPQ